MKLPILLAVLASVAVGTRQSQAGRNWHAVRPQSHMQLDATVSGTGGLWAELGVVGAAQRPWWVVALYVCGGLLVGIGIGAGIGVVLKRKAEAAEAQVTPAAGEEVFLSAGEEEPAAREAPPAPEAPPPVKSNDINALFQSVQERVSQTLAPKLAKSDEMRAAVEGRLTTFKAKAKALVVNELNGTAGALLKAVEAEEAMQILEWNNAVVSNIPPPSVLLAGLLSPSLLMLRQVSHLLQLVVGLLPIAVLCTWACIVDYHTVCAIPSIYAWAYTQAGLALVLSLGHGMLLMKIHAGKALISAKAKAMNDKLVEAKADDEISVSEMRDLFICASVLLQQALLIEDSLRRSIWHTITGAGSIVWNVTVLWNFIIVMGWTFFPGLVAFHPKAHEVAKGDFCGALMTVFAARLTCILHLLFNPISLLTMASWVSDLLITSPAYGNTLLKFAAKADKGILGIPVVQTLVKGFVLRGGSDLKTAQLAVATHDRLELQRELIATRKQVDALDSAIMLRDAEEKALQEKTKGGETADLEASIDQMETLGDIDVGDWKEKGAAQINLLQSQHGAAEEENTSDIEVVMNKLMEIAQMIQNSETFQSAAAQAQSAAEIAAAKATEVSKQMTAENLESVMAQAQQAAQARVSMVQDAMNSEEVQKALAQAQSAAASGLAQAQSAAEGGLSQAQQAMQSEEVQKALAQARSAAEGGLSQAQQAMQPEELKKALAQAQSAAEGGLSQAQQAMQSEEVQKALAQAQSTAEAGLSQAQQAVQSEEVKKALAQAQSTAEAGLSQAQQAAAKASSSAAAAVEGGLKK